MTQPSKSVERVQNIVGLIERMKPEIARALPQHLNPERMTRVATTILRQTPALARCTPESFLGALMTASQLGLEPGPLGEAYLVPFGDVCTFIAGYRGLVKLAYQSGLVATVSAHVVHQEDAFSFRLGLDPYLDHTPKLIDDPGPVVAAYAVVRLKSGAAPFEVMSFKQIEDVRRRSRASGSGPWVTDWEAMARKTVLRRLSKWVPLSSEFAQAVDADESIRTEISKMIDAKLDYPIPLADAPRAPITADEILGPPEDRNPTTGITIEQQPGAVDDAVKAGAMIEFPEQPAADELRSSDDITTAVDTTGSTSAEPARRRGRPKGSKNRPKDESVITRESGTTGENLPGIELTGEPQDTPGAPDYMQPGGISTTELAQQVADERARRLAATPPTPAEQLGLAENEPADEQAAGDPNPNRQSTPEQRARLKELRIAEKYDDTEQSMAEWFGWLSAAVSHDVNSYEDLSRDEAWDVIELLEEAQSNRPTTERTAREWPK